MADVFVGEAFDASGQFLGSTRVATFEEVASELVMLDAMCQMEIIGVKTRSFLGRLLIWLCAEREQLLPTSERWRALADVSTAIYRFRLEAEEGNAPQTCM